jgi:hypothetical protein
MNKAKRLALAAALTLAVCSTAPLAQGEIVPVAGGGIAGEISGTVVAVNADKRLMTVRTPDGEFQVIHVPPEVSRLDQVKINDELTIAYVAAVAVDLQKGTGSEPPAAVVTREIDREPGRKPEGSIVDTVTLTGKVTALNRAASTVTVKGPEESVTLTVDEPDLLEGVSVGDSVTATFVRAVAAKVQ